MEEFQSLLEGDSKHQQTNASNPEIELRSTITFLTKERDSLLVLWQTAQKTINALETELQTYQVFYKDEAELETIKDINMKYEASIQEITQLENKLQEIKTKNQALERNLKANSEEIQTYKERGKEIEKNLEDALAKIEEMKNLLETERKKNEGLRNELVLSQKESVSYVKKEAEAKSKVAETLQLLDLVMVQRDEAFKQIHEITEELTKVKSDLATVKSCIEAEHQLELESVREKYNEKLSDMLSHIRNLDSELVEKGTLLDQTLRENKILQSSNDKYVKEYKDGLMSVDPRLQIAEQKLDAMFQELVLSERRNIQLSSEREAAAAALQRASDAHDRESRTRDWEEGLMRSQIQDLRLQVESLEKSLQETHGMVSKLQDMLASRAELAQRMVESKQEQVAELNKHIENQMEMNRRWRDSYVDMTEKLKKRLNELQTENKRLRARLALSQDSVSNTDTDS